MLTELLTGGREMPVWLSLLVAFVLAPALALLVLWLLHALLDRLLSASNARVLQRVMVDGRSAVRVAVALLAIQAALPEVDLPTEASRAASRAAALGLVVALGWAATRKVAAVFDSYMVEELGENADWLQRRRRTQLIVFRRLAVSAGVALTAGLVLTAIPAVRTVGLSLFASAGVAGIVAGLAARPAVSNLIAGIQIALTQPIRLGDAVLVEGEWGHVAEITSTYVTIATWDQRSLVVPINYFTERPIRNWTKTSAQLLDTVFVYVDYTVPVAALRAEAQRILETSPLWDRRVFAVQVTDLKERSIEVRVLMSAANSGAMFDLRCLMREELVAFLAKHYPKALPQTRFTLSEAQAA
ncbi:mechanosensitive ion channel [Belnapia sp. T6]|uniref:Mechanosensitive ion channel n=1 Tax=Belnapia mucosa TaxID=2804532 RepID=A0ABS1V8X2_9PROT|nr:mechanosensitive ion channel domain-containing protein [Belnapia mucosa]MBL6458117.1 mechanosensitive ion channel [Belnapia mucosa]